MTGAHLIDSAFALRLTTTFLHFLWQGAVVALFAALVSQFLLRASAHARYTVHAGALIIMAICVSITFGLVSIDDSIQDIAELRTPEATEADSSVVTSATFPAPNTFGGMAEGMRQFEATEKTELELPPVSEAPVSSLPTPVDAEPAPDTATKASRHALLTQSAPWVTLVYFSGVSILLLRLLHGTWGSLRLRRSAAELVDRKLVDRIRVQAIRLGMRGIPLLRWSEEISVPVVIGIMRPLILLPASAATGLSVEQLEAVIAHELAHIRRYDLVINMLQRVIEALLFFHPAVWWVSRRISNEREQACDDLVLTAGFARTQYADALVRMAEVACNLRGRSAALPATALAADGAAPTEFKRRILKVLGVPHTSHLRPGRWAMFFAIACILLAATAPGILFHFSQTAAAQPAEAPDFDGTMDYLRSLRPDSQVAGPAVIGRELAKSDIAAGQLRILYCGKPWSAGKPLIDEETGYDVVIPAGCVVTRDVISLVQAYNATLREHHSAKAMGEPSSIATDHQDPAQHDDGAETMKHTIAGNSLKLIFSPDGKRLAVMNGNPTRTMFRDGRSVANDWRPTVEIIDTETEKVLRSLDLSGLPHDPDRPVELGPTFIEATAIAFSPDSGTLAVGTSVGQLQLFDIATGALQKSLDDEPGRMADEKTPDRWKQMPRVMGRVKSIAFSADGKLLAVCGESFADWSKTLDRVERGGLGRTEVGRLKVFEVATGKLKFNPAAHSDMTVDVAYSPDGRYLASAGRWMDSLEGHQFGDGVILWDAATGEHKARIDLALRGWMYDIEFSPDSQRILIGAQDFDEGGGNGQGVAAMLSTETLAVLWRRHITRSAMAVAFNPQQKAVIVLTNREGLSYIDAETGKTETLLTVADSEPPKKQRCEHFALSPQGHLLALGVVEKGQGHVNYLRIGKLEPNGDEAGQSLRLLNPGDTPEGVNQGNIAGAIEAPSARLTSGVVDFEFAEKPVNTGGDPAPAQPDIQVGMTFDEVIRIKGKHYRPYIGMGEGQLFLTYDDITIGVEHHLIGEGQGRVWRIDATPPDINELVGNIPYADTVTENAKPPAGGEATNDEASASGGGAPVSEVPPTASSEPPIVTVLDQPVTLSSITYKSITAADVEAKRQELSAEDFRTWLYTSQSLNLVNQVSRIVMKDYREHVEIRPTREEIAAELSAFVKRHPDMLEEEHREETGIAIFWTIGSSMDWVLAKHLHEKHGGRLATSSFGAFTAMDGRNAVLKEYADAGKIVFRDPEYESMFWRRTEDLAVLDSTIADQERIKRRLATGPWQQWILQMEMKLTEQLNIGMSLEEVISIKGRHYRLLDDGPAGEHLLAYDDVGVCMEPDPANGGARRVTRFYTKDLAQFAVQFPHHIQDVPYADAESTADNSNSEDGTDRDAAAGNAAIRNRFP